MWPATSKYRWKNRSTRRCRKGRHSCWQWICKLISFLGRSYSEWKLTRNLVLKRITSLIEESHCYCSRIVFAPHKGVLQLPLLNNQVSLFIWDEKGLSGVLSFFHCHCHLQYDALVVLKEAPAVLSGEMDWLLPCKKSHWSTWTNGRNQISPSIRISFLPQVHGSNSVGHFSIGTTSVGGYGCYPAVGRFFRFLPLLGGLLYPVETPVLVNEQADGWVVLSVIWMCTLFILILRTLFVLNAVLSPTQKPSMRFLRRQEVQETSFHMSLVLPLFQSHSFKDLTTFW